MSFFQTIIKKKLYNIEVHIMSNGNPITKMVVEVSAYNSFQAKGIARKNLKLHVENAYVKPLPKT